MERRKNFDLEDRTYKFANKTRDFLRKIPKSISNFEDSKQLTRSSGSVGANYIEARESLSEKDFIFRIKICRKEAKESHYWLKLIFLNNIQELENTREVLRQESMELTKIFGKIISNKNNNS